ncbi:hypothetical protein [Streptomyces sp. NPDC001020]
MGSLRLTLCAIAVIAAVLGRAGHTTDARDVSLTPASPAPGSDVRLAVRGCSGTTGTAVSDAFATDARLAGKEGMLTGDARVRSSLTPGRYGVTVGCGGHEVKGVVTVGEPTASAPHAPTGPAAPHAPTGPARPAAPSTPSPRLHLSPPNAPSSPVAPVRAGGGGTAGQAPESGEARSSGPGIRQAVIGLVLASVAAVVVAVRSIRRGRGKE